MTIKMYKFLYICFLSLKRNHINHFWWHTTYIKVYGPSECLIIVEIFEKKKKKKKKIMFWNFKKYVILEEKCLSHQRRFYEY